MASAVRVVQSGGSEEWKRGAKVCPDRMEAKVNVSSRARLECGYIVRKVCPVQKRQEGRDGRSGANGHVVLFASFTEIVLNAHPATSNPLEPVPRPSCSFLPLLYLATPTGGIWTMALSSDYLDEGECLFGVQCCEAMSLCEHAPQTTFRSTTDAGHRI